MEEKEKIETEQKVDDMTEDYLETIKTLKQNTVSKEDYNKILDENKKLLKTVIDGQPGDFEQPTPKHRPIQEIRDELFNKENNNLRFAELSLELRDAVIEEGGEDPFIPIGEKIQPTQEDREKASKVATVFKECIEYADGDSQLFTQELQRRTNK